MNAQSGARLEQALRALRHSGVVAHATEGVWGLACDPFSEAAVAKVLQIKARSITKGLLLIGASPEQFDPQLSLLPAPDMRRIKATWPGHVTWILPDNQYPAWVRGEHLTVACRVPAHAQARNLAAGFGKPLVSTSLNLSGGDPITAYEDATRQFADLVDYVLPGAVGDAVGPSQIREADGTVLR